MGPVVGRRPGSHRHFGSLPPAGRNHPNHRAQLPLAPCSGAAEFGKEKSQPRLRRGKETMSFSQPLSPGGESARFSPIHDRDRHGRAYSCWPGESVTRGDRRRRELVLENSSPPLAGQHESTARLRLRIGERAVAPPRLPKREGKWLRLESSTRS